MGEAPLSRRLLLGSTVLGTLTGLGIGSIGGRTDQNLEKELTLRKDRIPHEKVGDTDIYILGKPLKSNLIQGAIVYFFRDTKYHNEQVIRDFEPLQLTDENGTSLTDNYKYLFGEIEKIKASKEDKEDLEKWILKVARFSPSLQYTDEKSHSARVTIPNNHLPARIEVAMAQTYSRRAPLEKIVQIVCG